MIISHKHYIDGEFVQKKNVEQIPVINPATEELISYIPRGERSDADHAVIAAKKA